MTFLIIFYNIAISCLHPPNGFQFNFLLRDSAKQEFFRVSPLRDMKIATQEGCRVGQELTYRFGFC